MVTELEGQQSANNGQVILKNDLPIRSKTDVGGNKCALPCVEDIEPPSVLFKQNLNCHTRGHNILDILSSTELSDSDSRHAKEHAPVPVSLTCLTER